MSVSEKSAYVIFGVTGDLSRAKLMPALYHLEVANKLPEGTSIIAVGGGSGVTSSVWQKYAPGLKKKPVAQLTKTPLRNLPTASVILNGALKIPIPGGI